MQWSYSNDPASSPLDAVRFLSGDTDADDPLVDDREVNYAITLGSHDIAAAIICEHLAARFARETDIESGEAKEKCSQRAKAFKDRADELRQRAGIAVLPSFGGLSRSEKQSLASNTDAVQPFFGRDEFDNPNADQFDGAGWGDE
jgi:hypothetical protein